LTDSLPNFANATNMTSLSLHFTRLTGSIPSLLCDGLDLSFRIDCGEIECDCCVDNGGMSVTMSIDSKVHSGTYRRWLRVTL
jgi:hypothetical protein